MSNVQMVAPTTPIADEARWRCQVCGRELAYSQPISLLLAALLVGEFSKHHEARCGKEVPSGQ